MATSFSPAYSCNAFFISPVLGGFIQLSTGNGSQDILCHIVASAGHVQVAAGPKTRDTVMHSAPVGHNKALKTPFVPQNTGDQLLIIAAVDYCNCKHCYNEQ